MNKVYLITFLSAFCANVLYSQVLLDAHGEGNTYELINSVLAPTGNVVEVPDCNHESFGRHIDEVYDSTLQGYVFRFHIHVWPDNDRCINFDRQRNEIKTYNESPSNLLGVLGETFEYKWKFKIDSNFQSSSSFTHLHQLKAVGGPDDGMPLITLTTRKGSPDKLELRYAASLSQSTIKKVDLDPFKGVWIEVTETVTYGDPGIYSISLVNINSDEVLLSYNSSTKKMWKTDADFIRPKWGIYRSLNDSVNLRDEIVYFANFSIKETKDSIRPTVELSTSALEPITEKFILDITFSEPVNGFTEDDITVENGMVESGSLSSSYNTIFTATITPSSSGSVTLNVNAGVAQDDSGNDNEVSNKLMVNALLSIHGSAVNSDDFMLFTNPSNGLITIATATDLPISKVIVYDCNGKEVYKNNYDAIKVLLDLSHCKTGIYFIGVKNAQQELVRKLILK